MEPDLQMTDDGISWDRNDPAYDPPTAEFTVMVPVRFTVTNRRLAREMPDGGRKFSFCSFHESVGEITAPEGRTLPFDEISRAMVGNGGLFYLWDHTKASGSLVARVDISPMLGSLSDQWPELMSQADVILDRDFPDTKPLE